MFLKFMVAVVADIISISVIIGGVISSSFLFSIVIIASIVAVMLIADIGNFLFSVFSFM